MKPAEYEQAGRVVVAGYRALPGAHLSGGYAEELADVAGRAGDTEVIVAVGGDDEMLGCVTFVADVSSPWAELLEADESAIRMLGVDPAAQGRGIGQALVGACVERATQLGRLGLFLHSTPWMVAAHRLYERNGFVRVPKRDWSPTPEVPLIAYRLELVGRVR